MLTSIWPSLQGVEGWQGVTSWRAMTPSTARITLPSKSVWSYCSFLGIQCLKCRSLLCATLWLAFCELSFFFGCGPGTVCTEVFFFFCHCGAVLIVENHKHLTKICYRNKHRRARQWDRKISEKNKYHNIVSVEQTKNVYQYENKWRKTRTGLKTFILGTL